MGILDKADGKYSDTIHKVQEQAKKVTESAASAAAGDEQS